MSTRTGIQPRGAALGNGERSTAVVLFTDLVASTEARSQLGDEAAEDLRRRYDRLMIDAIVMNRGVVLKHLGDGVMATFSAASDGIAAAMAVQQTLDRHHRSAGCAVALEARIGVSAGDVTLEDGDCFGTPVIEAARLCGAADGGQILVSDVVRLLAGSAGGHRFRPKGNLDLKGLPAPVPAYEADWEQPAVSAAPRPGPLTGATYGVLRTRLLPPRLPPGCLPRPELVDRILTALPGRVVVLLAGAGYGKSTLLAQALAGTDQPWVWLSCDERIGGAEAFLAHVAAGLAERFPGVGAGLTLEGTIEEQAAELCNEVAVTITDDFVLALDDIHTLDHRPAAEALGLLVRDLPPTAHFALASRTALPLPLGRWRAGGITELGEGALALTEEESGELLRSARLVLSATALSDLHRRTEGWVAGLLLAAQSGGSLIDPTRLEAGGPSFDYLAEEVFARLPRETQDFLVETSILDRFTPSLAATVTGWPDATEIIATLVSGHLFTIQLQGGWYRYHHLFQAFLRRRQQHWRAGRRAELHRRAGDGWCAAGEPAEAVPHYLEAAEPTLAVDALEPVAEAMVATPAAETLAGWLAVIPEEIWSTRPGLILAHASLLCTRGAHEASYERMERALDALLEAGEHERAAVAFFRLLQNMIASGTGSPRRVEAARRYVPRLDPSTRLLPAARVMLAVVYGYSCGAEEAEAELRAVRALPAASSSPIVDLYADVVRWWYVEYPRGRVEEALHAITEAIAGLERLEADDLFGFLAYARIYRTILLVDLARPDAALAEAGRFEEEAARRGMGGMAARFTTWLRLEALAGLERWEELEHRLVPLDRVAPPGQASNFAYRYAVPLALLAAHRGDAATVAAVAASARRAVREHGPALDQPWHLCDLALAAHRAGLPELARDLAAEARTLAQSFGLWWWQARAAIIGSTAWGDGDEGDRLLGEALELTARHDLTPLWTRRERERAAGLLGRALRAGLGPPGVAAKLAVACGGDVVATMATSLADAPPAVRAALAEAAGEATGVDPTVVHRLARDSDPHVRQLAQRARARLAAAPRPPVRIVSLGGFAVWRGGDPVPELTSGRQKSRTLLAILLTADGPLHREMLLEWLWPHLPPDRALASLHSALYALRQALEPGTSRSAPSTLVVTDGEAYRLNLEPGDEWDAAAFLRLARTEASPATPELRLERLLAAEAARTGPFLPEWPYEDWAAPRRAELERAYLEVLEQLAETLTETKQARAAITRYHRLVEVDPDREGWHRALMEAYVRAGERGLALRQYHACRTRLREHLGVEPSPETRALYTSLL